MLQRTFENNQDTWAVGASWGAVLCICLWFTLSGVTSANPLDENGSGDKRVAASDQPGNLRLVQGGEDMDPPGSKSAKRRQRISTAAQKAKKGRKPATSSSRDSRRKPPSRGHKAPKRPSRAGEPVTSRLNIEAADMNKSPEERSYSFSIVDGTYKELVENFGRMAGLPVLGEAPTGVVTFVSTEEMDFKSAMARVRLLLFKFSPIEPYWLENMGDHFEVLRVTDFWRRIDLDHLFMNLNAFRAANIEENELAMLLYTPTDTSVSEYAVIRDFMPDYVRIAPMPETNSLAIFALVSDIKKYLELIRLFEGAADDPRVLDKLPVLYLAPSRAVETLRLLMDDLYEVGKPKPRRPRGGVDTAIDLPGQRTILFPDDAQGVIVVRAVPKQIKEIRRMLDFIDVDLGRDFDPVLIPIENINVNELVTIIRPLVAEGQVFTPPGATKAGKRKSTKPSRPLAGTVQSGGVLMIPVQRTNTLVVLGSLEEVDHVRHLVALFDVPLEEGGPVFVEIEHVPPGQIAGMLPKIIKPGKGKSVGEAFTVIAEPTTNSVILIGSKQDVETAKSLIEVLDIPGEVVALHSYKLLNGSPKTVMELIALLDSRQTAQVTPRKGKGAQAKSRSARPGRAGSNLHVDEEAKMLYVLCTEADWLEKYLPLIQQIDDQAAEPEPHARIDLVHISPDDVIGILTPLISGRAKKTTMLPKLAPAGDAIIVIGATPAEVAHLRAIVAEIDQEADERQWRLFELKHADPGEIQSILQSGIVAGTAKARPRASKGVVGAARGVVISLLGKTLVVSALPDQMEEIADLIQHLDVESADDTVIRVYAIPPGLDVQDVASLLESLVMSMPNVRRKPGVLGSQSNETRIVAQGISRKLLIIAPKDRFERIEEALDRLLEGEAPEPFLVRFFRIEHVEAEAIAALIEPILQIREKELRAMGALPKDSDLKKRSSPLTSSLVTVSSDVQGDRIVVTAPSPIIAEAEALIEQLDRPGSQGDRIMRVITLTRSTPDEIVAAVGAMLTRKPGRPVRVKRPRIKKVGGEAKFVSQSSEDVTIVAAPGGGSVIVSGYSRQVDEVERWIRELDSGAKPERTLKIYNIDHADLDQLAESIMALCDVPGPTERAKKRLQDEGFEDMFASTTGIRHGTEITLSLDYLNRIIVARATPSKIYEIDTVVEMYEGKEGEDPLIPETGMIPFLIYELESTDAFDAAIELNSLLDVLWPYPEDKPGVDYISGTNKLVVKCLPERGTFVKSLITEYVDKESTKVQETKRVFKTITGLTPSDVAVLLKMRMPGVDIQLEKIGVDIPILERVRPYQPCVLPQSLLKAVAAAALAQTAEQSTGEPPKEELAKKMIASLAAQDLGETDQKALKEDTADEPEETRPIIIRYDDRAGVVVIEGAPREVDEVKDVLDDILDEIESMSTKPDIRVYRIKYRDVNVAANILETMFGDIKAPQRPQQRGGGAQQQLIRRMQQQMQRQMQQMMRQQGQQGVAPTPPIDPRTGQPIKPGEEEEPKKTGTGAIRIHPDPQTRTLIVRASTEDFPIIVELLATIDRPPDFKNEHRIFKLVKLRAVDVEEQLKVLLGITRTTTRRVPARRPSQRGKGRQQTPGLQQIEDALLNLNLGAAGEGAINASSDIVITSITQANALIVMAPQAAIDLIAKLIEELESQEIPILETRTYVMVHADATGVATQLKQVFSLRGGGKGTEGFDPNIVNQATFTAEPRTSTLIVRALDADFPKIEPLIEELDRDLGDQQVVITFTLENADATQVANTMNSAYGGGGRSKGGGQAIKFVGDASSNSVFVVAPDQLRDEIAQRIRELDELAGGLAKPKVIKLLAGSAEEIARKLQDVFRARGRKGDAIKITGDDNSKQIFVTAPDNIFPEIEKHARSMDLPSTIVDVKAFVLVYARAAEVHEKLMTMVRQAASQIKNKKALDVFTATADERTNSIIVLGGPTSFALVEKALKQIDVPAPDQSQIVTAIYHLANADAIELARNVNSVYGKKGRRGAGGPTAEANRSNNSLILRGPKAQVEEIYAEMIKPLEDQAAGAGRVREILTLEYAEAADVARMINEEINKSRSRQKRDGRQPLSVIANESLNSLIVSGPGDEVKDIVALARNLDQEPTATKQRITRVIPIKYADPNSLVGTIRNMFRKQRGQRPEEMVEVDYDWGTSKLIVTANPENLEKIEKMLQEVDVESMTVRSERVIILQYASAQELGRNLQNMFRQNIRGKRGQQVMNIFGDLATNSLIVYANDEEFSRVKSIVDALDVRPVESRDRAIRSFTLANANPWTIADAIRQIYRPRGRQANPRDQVIAVPEGTTMSVIVSASPERMEEIEKLVAEFDKPGQTDSDVHVIEIDHADAASVAQALQQIFLRSGGRNVRGQATIQISNPRGSDMIVIKANEQKYQEVLKTIEALDSASAGSGEIEVIVLQHNDAEMMKETLENYLRKSGQRGRGAELVGDLRITANAQNNTLVISGDLEEVTRLKDTIAKLDVEVEGAGNAPRIIELQHARAAQIEPVLTQMFVDGGRRGRRGRGRSSGASMTPVITSDEPSNTLIIRASASDFGMIEDLIEKLDTETSDDSIIKIIPVAEGINVIDLAQLVESTVNENEQIRAGRFPGMVPGTVILNPDPRTNVVVVAGTPTLFPDVERLLKSLESMGPTGRLSTRIIKINNMSPDEVTRLLDRIIQENTQSKSGSGKAKSRRSIPKRRPPSRRPSQRRR